MIVPNGMDGVGGLTQPHIKPGKTFVYEFELKKSGTFMYHPHSDEMVQMAMGMMGMFVVHPRDPTFRPVDRDFVFVMSTYRIDPGTYLPKVNEMTDFNMWTWNAPRLSRHRSAAGPARRQGARAHRQSHHDQPPDPSARPQLCRDLHRRRLDSGERAISGDDHRRAGRRHPRVRRRSPTIPATGRSTATSRITP